jgi:dihydroorotase
MLVDNEATLEKIFSSTPMLIAVHCEDETTVQNNLKNIRQSMVRMFLLRFIILSVVKRLVISSSKAVALAKKTGARLHIFHLSTKKWICSQTKFHWNKRKLLPKFVYTIYGLPMMIMPRNLIKWNPAVKQQMTKSFGALLDGRIDVVATDHAPHTWKKRNNPILKLREVR